MPRTTIPMPAETTRFLPNLSETALMSAEEAAKMSRGNVVSNPMAAALNPRSACTERESAPRDVMGARKTEAVKKMATPMRRALDFSCPLSMNTIVRVGCPTAAKALLFWISACACDREVTV